MHNSAFRYINLASRINTYERLYSKAGCCITHRRQNPQPSHFETQIFPDENKEYWGLPNISTIMKRALGRHCCSANGSGKNFTATTTSSSAQQLQTAVDAVFTIKTFTD